MKETVNPNLDPEETGSPPTGWYIGIPAPDAVELGEAELDILAKGEAAEKKLGELGIDPWDAYETAIAARRK